VKAALDVHRLLIERGVRHEILRLPRPVASSDELPAVLGVDPASCTTTVLYAGADATFAAAVVPAGARPSLGPLQRTLGSGTLRLARAEEVNAVTDFAAPLLPPVGLPEQVRVVLHFGLSGVLYTATGESGTALGLDVVDLVAITLADVADLRPEPLGGPVPDRPLGR